MEKYFEYKEINLPWLKMIPVNWDIRRNKQFLHECKKTVGDKSSEYTLLSLTLRGVVARDLSENKGKIPASFKAYKIVQPGDIAFCLFDMDETPRTVGLSKYKGMLTGAYNIFHIEGINAQYFYYYYLALDNVKALRPLYTGLRKTINVNTFLSQPIPFPPRAEQDQIVCFLDWKVSEINKLIGIRRKEIQELEELRENTILHTTTSGLDTSVPMKRTDNFWIGTIPEHWNVVQVRRVYSVILGKMLATEPADSSDTYEEYVCAKDVHFDGVDLSDLKQMWFSTSEKQQYKIKANDLLIVEGGAGAGNAALVEEPLDRDVYVQNSIHIVRPKSNRATTKFLAYWMRSMVKRNYMAFVCSVATIPHYTKDKVMSTVMPLPPENEQKEIVRYLDNECEKINNLITKKRSQIATLQELENSLISDVVTGKIDVRNVTIPEYEHVDDIVDDDLENNEETETDREEA
ncbi:restriction endonuclease subunit S [Lactobacillus delbrueckii]|uniref:restriction endonuclease subunit S n=1 Tax=Lactobacillus delbrueckii TaxID=1584 RepID=UPI001E2EFDDA|nr:restriction endonuclease subunit S [Lactobacillus delbrueckii]MCD5533279.1 restriction endonuclease subunit S [Lactobacillus delbrueckii subsp. lactis]